MLTKFYMTDDAGQANNQVYKAHRRRIDVFYCGVDPFPVFFAAQITLVSTLYYYYLPCIPIDASENTRLMYRKALR